jgi:hypothetical protein
MRSTFAFAIGLVCALLAAAHARAAAVMILGTWHMAPAGHDLHNLRGDDVLLEPRQRELARVAEALLAFHPDKVAVETPAPGRAPAKVEKYAMYRDGTLGPERNEVVQLGFRLADRAGLHEVWGIDVPGELPYAAVERFAQRHGAPFNERLDALNAAIERLLDGLTRVLQHGSIADGLRYVNDATHIAQNHAFYTGMAQFHDAIDRPGPALLQAWETRNAAICAHLQRLVAARDRVVVVFGSGHAYLLRQCVRDQGWELVEPAEYLPR